MIKILYAFRFLTMLPIPYKQNEDLQQTARSSVWFPFVGLIIGGLLAAAYYLVNLAGFTAVSAVLVIVLWILLTGGLHLDGLADTFDGLGGGRTRERRLEIMKDSRIGTFGALAIIAQLGLKTALVYDLPAELIIPALAVTPMIGRTLLLFLFRIFPSARPDGMGCFFQKNGTWAEPIVGSVYMLAVLWFLFGLTGLIASAITSIIILLYSIFLNKRLGGLTGDCYGSVIEISEVLMLLSIAVIYTLTGGSL